MRDHRAESGRELGVVEEEDNPNKDVNVDLAAHMS
jgi:hypothetical protein